MSTPIFAREFEHAPDLPGMVGVVAGCRADHLGAALEALDQQFVGAGIVGQPLLREDAQLDVDRPLVFVDQRLHAVEAAHADAGIDLDMRAHARRAVLDAILQRLFGARVNVLGGEGLLHLPHPLDGIRHALGLGRAALDDA